MFSVRVDWLRYLPIFIAFTVIVPAASILKNGSPKISEGFGADKIIVVLFVGITEETVFRGWLLNITLREDKKPLCLAVNALMFLAVHFPGWIHGGVFVSNFAQFGFLTIIALSVVFGWTFIKSRSILVPIALHMYWDLLAFMLT